MAKKYRKASSEEFDTRAHLRSIGKLPEYVPNKLVLVPSFLYRGRLKLDEDYDDDKLSYRLASDFIELRYPIDIPVDAYPFVSEPVYGFKCGNKVDGRLLELIRLVREMGEVHFDELHLTEFGSKMNTRAEVCHLLNAIDPDVSLMARIDGAEEFDPTDTEELKATTGLQPTLQYSYSSAFRAFGIPLIKNICIDRPDLSDFIRQSHEDVAIFLKTGRPQDGSWQPDLVNGLSTPSAMAALYALRGSTSRDRAKLLGQLLRGETAISLGDTLQEGQWLGTGDFDPVPATSARTDFLSLLASGLAEGSPELGEVRVSDYGNRLVDAVADECNDTDWLARLFDAEEGIIDRSQYPLMADWVKMHSRLYKYALDGWMRENG